MLLRRTRPGWWNEESRQESVALAGELLGAGFTPEYVGAIAQLAPATQESDLRGELNELATNRAAWNRRKSPKINS